MFRFRKSQRITSLKEMDNLFERSRNNTAQAYPLRAVFRIYVGEEGNNNERNSSKVENVTNNTEDALNIIGNHTKNAGGEALNVSDTANDSDNITINAEEETVNVSDTANNVNNTSYKINITRNDIKNTANNAVIPLKVLISVGKKRFHHAVDRNRAKRQIREAFRLQQSSLFSLAQERGIQVHIAFIWLSNKPMPSQKVSSSVKHILSFIQEKIATLE